MKKIIIKHPKESIYHYIDDNIDEVILAEDILDNTLNSKNQLKFKFKGNYRLGIEIFELIDDKYYTPNIEEFYVGFRYEIKDGGKENYREAIIRTIDCYCSPENGYNYPNSIYLYSKWKNGDVRVKYLDSSDIESEGWDIMSEDENIIICNSDIFFNYSFTYYTDSNHLHVFKEVYGDVIKIFEGTIKNISEFRRILKMLNIKK